MPLGIQQGHRDTLAQTSWKDLRPDVLELLCQLLDEEQHIRTTNKVFRDWRGLWQKTKLNNNDSLPTETASPTKQLLAYLEEKRKQFTVMDLLENLEEMDRHDIIEKLFEKRPNSLNLMILEDSDFAQESHNTMIISAEQDNDFVEDLIRRLKDCNLSCYSYQNGIQKQVFDSVKNEVKPCQMVKHDITSILSNQRCKKIIVVFSPEFLNNSAYYFLLNDVYDQFNRECTIIPIIWKHCEIANYNLKFLSKIVYSTEGGTNFYERLLVTTLGVKAEDLTEENKKVYFMADADAISSTAEEVINLSPDIRKPNGWRGKILGLFNRGLSNLSRRRK